MNRSLSLKNKATIFDKFSLSLRFMTRLNLTKIKAFGSQ